MRLRDLLTNHGVDADALLDYDFPDIPTFGSSGHPDGIIVTGQRSLGDNAGGMMEVVIYVPLDGNGQSRPAAI